MRTTLELPDPLFREVKARAAQTGVKLKELLARYIEAGLRAPFTQTVQPPIRRTPPVAIKRIPGTPTVPALNNAQLNVLLDQEDMERYRRSSGMTNEAP
jgi:hypothetical protein